MSINSPIRLDLPTAPSLEKSDLFNELLVTYNSIRALHLAATEAFGLIDITQEALENATLTSFYGANRLSRLIVKAGAAIIAGRFLEVYEVGGELKCRHTRCASASAVSLHSIGVSLSDVAVNDFAVVQTMPSIIPGYSGLIPGTPYFFYDDGTFTTDPSPVTADGLSVVRVRQVGFAVSSSEMLILSLSNYAY